MSDPTKRPLEVPKSYIPYLEKHNIYRLFHELIRELVIHQPEDHVLFTKQILTNAANARNVTRVIMLQTPKVNCLKIAKAVAATTKHVVISNEDLKKIAGIPIEKMSSKFLVSCLSKIVRLENCLKYGWIMVDCIRNGEDAKALLRAGIIPTHVLHPIAPFHQALNELLYCNVKYHWPTQRRNIVGIRNTFSKSVREIYLHRNDFGEVVKDTINIINTRKSLKPIKPRVVLLGPRGSGRKTQGNLLAKELNLVYINFEYLICQVWMGRDELTENLKKCGDQACFRSDLLAQVVNKRILEYDCLNNGWVLIGFPYTINDFKYLDMLDTPPNRVIFLECELNICKERIASRLFNAYTGSVVNVNDKTEDYYQKMLKPHPKNHAKIVEAEINFYCQNYGELRKYCGDTAHFVNGDQDERTIHEIIIAIMVNEPPTSEPRVGFKDLEILTDSDSCDCLSLPTDVGDCFIQKV